MRHGEYVGANAVLVCHALIDSANVTGPKLHSSDGACGGDRRPRVPNYLLAPLAVKSRWNIL